MNGNIALTCRQNTAPSLFISSTPLYTSGDVCEIGGILEETDDDREAGGV